MPSSNDLGAGSGRAGRVAAVVRAAVSADIVVGLAVILLLGFAPASRLAAEWQPTAMDPMEELVWARPRPSGAAVKDLPVGLPEGVSVTSPESLGELAESALGRQGAIELNRLLRAPFGALAQSAVGGEVGSAPYPYRYPAMTRILDLAPDAGRSEDAAVLGAALVVLAAQWDDEGFLSRYSNAGPAAFAVLHRAGSTGDCQSRLNLLLLVAADNPAS